MRTQVLLNPKFSEQCNVFQYRYDLSESDINYLSFPDSQFSPAISYPKTFCVFDKLTNHFGSLKFKPDNKNNPEDRIMVTFT